MKINLKLLLFFTNLAIFETKTKPLRYTRRITRTQLAVSSSAAEYTGKTMKRWRTVCIAVQRLAVRKRSKILILLKL